MSYGIADLDDLGSVRAFAATFRAEQPRLDVLIHNAGALSRYYQTSADGTELTVATQVVAPFVLTSELLALLSASAPSRVITVSSGGMYTQRYDLDQLEIGPDTYDGVTAYARAKRAQLVLNREWARRQTGSGIAFHAMHPGWADTPGVQTALPAFRHVTRPLLRTADEGSDTIIWLAASTKAARCSGLFWHDRRPRWEHKLPWTRPADFAVEGQQLWDWCTRSAAPRQLARHLVLKQPDQHARARPTGATSSTAGERTRHDVESRRSRGFETRTRVLEVGRRPAVSITVAARTEAGVGAKPGRLLIWRGPRSRPTCVAPCRLVLA